MGFLPKKKSFKVLISFWGNLSCVGEVVMSIVVRGAVIACSTNTA